MDKKLSENLKVFEEEYGLIIDNNTLYSGHTHTRTGSFDATNTLEDFVTASFTDISFLNNLIDERDANNKIIKSFKKFKDNIFTLKDFENNKEKVNVKSVIFVTDHDSDKFFSKMIEELNLPADIPAVVLKNNNEAIIIGRGIEQNIQVENTRQHLLVYFPDPTNEEFYNILKEKEINNKEFDYHYFYQVNDILAAADKEKYRIRVSKEDARALFDYYKDTKANFSQFSKEQIIEAYVNRFEFQGNVSQLEKKYFTFLMQQIIKNVKEPIRLVLPADFYIGAAKKTDAKLVWAHPNSKCKTPEHRDNVSKKLYELGIDGEEDIYSQRLKFNNNNPNSVLYSSGADSHHITDPIFDIYVANIHKKNVIQNVDTGKHTIHALDYPLIMNDLMEYMIKRKNSTKTVEKEDEDKKIKSGISNTKARIIFEKVRIKAKQNLIGQSKVSKEQLEEL